MSGGSAFAARPEPPPRVRFADLDDSAPSACAPPSPISLQAPDGAASSAPGSDRMPAV